MIQRKQTLYLLLSGLIMLIPIFLPLLVLIVPDTNTLYEMGVAGVETTTGEQTLIYPTWFLFALNILMVLLSFVAIFLYQKRTVQMRMTMFNLILKAGFYILLIFYVLNFQGDLQSISSLMIRPWIAAPVVAMILDYLAHRGIAIDDRTIRYMDRLR